MAEKNDQYIFKAKEILKLIIGAGVEAYIVGESLRDIILDRDIEEVEIFTGLPKESALLLFCDYKITDVDQYTIFVDYLGYRFKISFARPYTFKNKAKPNIAKRHYSTSLMDFLEFKDFTINTLAMGINNIIYDCYNGREDINKKRIKMISENPSLVFTNNPIKILTSIRLVSELGYRLDKNLYVAIKNKARLLKSASLEDIAWEMKKIFEGKFFKKALKLLIKTNVYKRLQVYRREVKRLYKNFAKEDLDTFLGICLVREKKYLEEVGKTSNNSYLFQTLVNLAITNPKGNYDVLTLYSAGLDVCVKANEINFILNKANKKTRQITKAYNALPIKKTCDLAFKGEDILNLFQERTGLKDAIGGEELTSLVDEIIVSVLEKKLKNDYDEIKNYVLQATADSLTNVKPKEIIESNEEVVEIDSNEEPIKTVETFEEKNIAVTGLEGLQKRQEELLLRVNELELSSLRAELEKEIERKIKQSGLLDGLSGNFRNTTYDTLQKVYYDVLINSEKYERLREKDNE